MVFRAYPLGISFWKKTFIQWLNVELWTTFPKLQNSDWYRNYDFLSLKGSVHHKYKRCLKHFIWSIYEPQIFLNFFWAFFHDDRVGPKLRIRSIDSKIRSMESKDKANGKETWDCTMAAFRCRGQMTFLMYAAICTHSSGNFEHNLYLRCKLPLNRITNWLSYRKKITTWL